MMRHILFLGCMVSMSLAARAQHPVHTFGFQDDSFVLDGKPIVLISGEMHFARIPREYWRDRLRMARAMGLNTIATYVFWNYHEPEPGIFDFSGNADVAEFVRIAQEEGLWIIIRPSPYACAEWEFGGYPWWLLNEKDLKVRSRQQRFLELSERYFRQLAAHLVPLQITRGGNIIMVQLENEYGSYDSDKEYLALNRKIIRDSGFDVELYTCDGPSQMSAGYLPGVLPAVNGLDDVPMVKELVNKHHGGRGPYFIAEWYPAWFDTWGVAHHVVPAADYAKRLDAVLAAGISINMYMVHGGTTRGFMNGANVDKTMPFSPQITSYDYDAPIDEAGNATPKYVAFREVILKHLGPGHTVPPVPPPKPAIAIPPFPLTEESRLFSHLPQPTVGDRPVSFEDLHQGYGFVLYRANVRGPRRASLQIHRLRDYALVFVNGTRVAVLDRRLNEDSVMVDIPAGEATLDLLVENLGRINYGPFLNDNRKGITERVTLNGREVRGWSMYRFPFTDVSGVQYSGPTDMRGPVIRRGVFTLTDTGDTYLDMSDWGKGCVWVNGHSIGRFWHVGPQQTLYVPAAWLRTGRNEVVVLELLREDQSQLQGRTSPILDELSVPTITLTGRYDRARGASVLAMASTSRGAVIHYATDGSVPTTASLRYSGEVAFGSPSAVAARAFKDGIQSDAVARVDVIPSLSTGRIVKLTHPFSGRYPAGGEGSLVDGFRGSQDFKDGFWQGFEGSDLEAVIDLAEIRQVRRVRVRFLQNTPMWVFHPREVEVAVSTDGNTFTAVGRAEEPVADAHREVTVKEIDQSVAEMKARYVRLRAVNVGTCPPWHGGAGGKAWLFCDEITVE